MDDYSIIHMPWNILINILVLLDMKDRLSLMMTCKTLRDWILNENSLWKPIRQRRLIVNSNSDFNPISWYNRCRISNNWCKGIYRNKVIIQHPTNYMPWVQFIDPQLLLLSVGSELRCYSIDNRSENAKNLWTLEVQKVQTNDIRTNDISRFVIRDNNIVCANRDGCVSLYKFKDKRKRPHLVSHIKDCHRSGIVEVSAVEKTKNVVITAATDEPKVCVWQLPWSEQNHANKSNLKNYCNAHCINQVHLLACYGCRSLSVNKGQDRIALGLNGNGKPAVLDLETSSVFLWRSYRRNKREIVVDVQWHDENVIAFVTRSGRLCMLDTRNFQLVYTAFDPFHTRMYCLRTDCDHTILVGTSEYSRCVLYDTRIRDHVQLYFTQKKASPIYSLDFDTTRLIAAADRGVAALNFNVNSSSTQKRDFSDKFICYG